MDKTKTIKTLERIKRDLLSHTEDLDPTYEECKCCSLRKYTNRMESLLRVDILNLVSKIDYNLNRLEKNDASD